MRKRSRGMGVRADGRAEQEGKEKAEGTLPLSGQARLTGPRPRGEDADQETSTSESHGDAVSGSSRARLGRFEFDAYDGFLAGAEDGEIHPGSRGLLRAFAF